MLLKSLTLGLVAPVLAALVQPIQPAAAQTGNAPVQAPADSGVSAFGAPLYVNGKRISDNDIKRFLIYGPCRLMLEMYRIKLIVDDELTRRAREAADAAVEPEVTRRAQERAQAALAQIKAQKPFETPEAEAAALEAELTKARQAVRAETDVAKAWEQAYEQHRTLLDETMPPSEAEYEAELARAFDDFKKAYPILNLDAEVARAYRTVDWFKTQLRQTMLFDRVYLPEDPIDWPIVTVEAMRADSGDTLVDDAKVSYTMRKEHAEKTGEPLPKDDSMLLNVHRQIVRDAMYSTIDFRTSFEGIPDDLVLWADKNGDGKPELTVSVEEVWNTVKDTVTPTEIQEAKEWFVTLEATRDRLQKEGALVDQQTAAKAIADLRKSFEGTYFNIDILAMQTHFFPSTEAYLEYYVLAESFKKLMEPKLQKQENGDIAQPLRDYLDRSNRIMGLGQVDVEIMLVSAFDIPNFKWKPDGWTWAKAKAEKIKADLDANIQAYNEQRAAAAKAKAEGTEFKPAQEVMEPYRYWSTMMDDNSEYWDPPAPEGQGKRGSDVGMKNRGRFGLRYRNDLQGFVGETPYRHWVTGDSITDFTFFDQAEGTVAGPFKGPLGYYLTRVQRRTAPTRPLNLGEPKHVDLLRDDYLRVAFVDYAKEARAKAEVKGL